MAPDPSDETDVEFLLKPQDSSLGGNVVTESEKANLPPDKHAVLEAAYVQHLLVFVQSGDQDTSFFRTLADSWFAHWRQGAYLSRGGRPIWLNKPHPIRHRQALLGLDFCSEEARSILDGHENGSLVKDHAIPLRYLKVMLLKENPSSLEAVRIFMRDSYKTGLLTSAEHALVNRDFKDSMPEGWRTIGPFARYSAAGICGTPTAPPSVAT